MTMAFHVKPFEKKVFEEVIFLLKYHQNPQVFKRWSIEKREKYWKKRKKEKERKRKRKALRVSSNKGEVNILRGEKTLQLHNSFFYVIFSPIISISKTLSKIIEKVFLTLFGPSFSLAIYMTWVVPFFFTCELHIFSL
jgi:hypothetical protein